MTAAPQQRPAILSALWGVAQFARGRNDHLYGIHFDMAGFWHSFIAILLILPMLVLHHYIHSGLFEDQVFDPWRQVLIALLGWPVFAIALAPAAAVLGFKDRYVPMIVLDHWISVLQSALIVFPVFLLWIGLPQGLFQVLYFSAFLVSLWLGWRAYRLILGNAVHTVFCLVYNLVLGLAMNQFFSQIL